MRILSDSYHSYVYYNPRYSSSYYTYVPPAYSYSSSYSYSYDYSYYYYKYGNYGSYYYFDFDDDDSGYYSGTTKTSKGLAWTIIVFAIVLPILCCVGIIVTIAILCSKGICKLGGSRYNKPRFLNP